MLIISFPHNPTTQVVDLDFFEKVVKAAKEHEFLVVHDLAYADLTFDGYQAPSFLQAAGAKDVGVEFFSLSKSYNMPGWRVGFCVGNKEIVQALARIELALQELPQHEAHGRGPRAPRRRSVAPAPGSGCAPR